LRVNVGNAFGIVAERRLTGYEQIAKRVFEYAYDIKVSNHKEEAAIVFVNEPFGGDWEMICSSFSAEKTAAFAARFVLLVQKGGEAVFN
jgi:hypothetical protein